MARKKTVSGSRHAGPTSKKPPVTRSGASGSKAGSPPIGSSREPLAGSGSPHRRAVRQRGVLPGPDGSSTRRIATPSGHHRAPGVHNPGRTTPWNPLPVGDWKPAAAGSGARWIYQVGTPQSGHHHLAPGRPDPPTGKPRARKVGRWAVLGGLIGAALLSAGAVAIMAAAAPGASPGTPPDAAAVSSTSITTDLTDAAPGDTEARQQPSSALRIPAPPGTAQDTAQGQRPPSTPGTSTPGTPNPSTSTPPTAAPTGPAIVSELDPSDPGFGWPATAFGTAPQPN